MWRSVRILAVVAMAAACSERAHEQAQPMADVVAQCKAPDLGCPRPIFGVRSLKSALAYYRDVLGFTVDWVWGEPADFASVSRGGATVFVGENDSAGHGGLWVFTHDVDALYAELRDKRARIKMPPTNMPWGNRELHVLDPDGNLLRFGGRSR